jgi:RNA polymerase sigma factor (TIGR02999 family)
VTPEPEVSVTRLLRKLAEGNRDAEAELVPLVYKELHRIARSLLRGEAQRKTLQTTALVHEAYLRLTRSTPVDWQDRTHFLAVAATVMRRVLVDHARARDSAKRGGGAVIAGDFMVEPAALTDDSDRVLALDRALDRLAQMDARQCRIVEMRFFAGMTVEETAAALDISPRTVKREWQMAKAWLYGELTA